MIKSKTDYSAKPLLLLIGFALVLMFQQLSMAATELQVKTITSQAIAGDSIVMKHRVSGDLQLEGELLVELYFVLSPEQLLTLDFVDSHQYQFIDEVEAVYSADQQGALTVKLSVMPLTAGKIYIKFLASTTDDQRIRSFSIPLQIKDKQGQVPEKQSRVKSRVNLPVKGAY